MAGVPVLLPGPVGARVRGVTRFLLLRLGRAVLTIASLRGAQAVTDDLFELLPQLQQCAQTIGRVAGIT